MNRKRERKSFSMQEKFKILEKAQVHRGTRVALSKSLGISVSTINTIIKNKDSITEGVNESGPYGKKRKYATYSKYLELEEILKSWFQTAHASNIPVSGVLLREKARTVAERLGIENFSASNGWIDRFKKRYNVVYKAVCGEENSVKEEIVREWQEKKLKHLAKQYELKDIFNIDETGLFFSVLPNKTLTFKGENCHGGKHSKLRLTVMLGANADGSEKLSPFVIGKSKKPRCFKNIKTLPTHYDANKKAWMTSELFERQMHALDAKMGARNRKILLFIDQCPAHPKNLNLRNIKLEFFPANCTSKLQPMDLGVIHAFKCYYRKSLVQKASTLMESGKDSTSFKLSVLNALHYIAKAWREVKNSTISNSFIKAGFLQADVEEVSGSEEEDSVLTSAWEKLQMGYKVQDFLHVDDEVITVERVSLEDMVDSHIQEEDTDEGSDSSDDDYNDSVPTHAEVTAAMTTVKKYISAADGDVSSFDTIYELEKQIEMIHQKKSKQTTILDFFIKQ